MHCPPLAVALRKDLRCSQLGRASLVLALACIAISRASAQVGPDGFGYTAIRSIETGGPTFQFVDIRATGLLAASGDDVSSITTGIQAPVPLGKPFAFYGTLHAELVPSTNGYISTLLTDNGTDLGNECPLPLSPGVGGGARIYVLHDDLVGDVYYQYFPRCPRTHDSGREMGASVFLWSTTHFNTPGDPFLFEALLYDNGDLVFQHAAGNPEHGSESTTGIQNEGATIGLTVACDTAASVPDDSAVRISRGLRDDLLELVKAKFAIDWAKHQGSVEADSLSIDATVARAGLALEVGGASVSLTLNGAELLDAVELDAKGNAASAPGVTPSFKLRLDAKRGRLTAQFKALDLRDALGLANATEEGSTRLVIGVDVQGAGLLTPRSHGTFDASYSTVSGKRTSGSFATKANATLSGVLRFLSFSVTEALGLHSFTLKQSVLIGDAAFPILLVDEAGQEGDVRITIGEAAPIAIPFAYLEVAGADETSVYAYDPALGTVQHLASFEIDNARRTMTFEVGALSGTGIPLAGAGAPLTHELEVVIDCETPIGVVRLQTVVHLRRSSETSTSWTF